MLFRRKPSVSVITTGHYNPAFVKGNIIRVEGCGQEGLYRILKVNDTTSILIEPVSWWLRIVYYFGKFSRWIYPPH